MGCHIKMENGETQRPTFLQLGIRWVKIKENIWFIDGCVGAAGADHQ